MTKWTRNISIAIVIGLIVTWAQYIAVTGNGPDLSDLLPLLIGSILLCATLTSVIWALGFTRLSYGASRRRSAIVLTYLEQAVRLNLPLPQMLHAAEMSEPRWIANGILNLRMYLQAGSSVAEAIRNAVPETPRRTIALVSAAERVGRVGSELNRIVRQQQNERDQTAGDRAFLRCYPVAMVLVLATIVSLIMIFVIPRYTQIFRDFKVAMPTQTIQLIHFVDFFFSTGWMLVVLLAVLIIGYEISRRYFKWPGPLRWYGTPRDLSDVCHIITEGLEAGLPLDAAIDGAADLSIGRSLRPKLRGWADGIVSGMTSADAAHAAGLPRLIAGLTITADGFAFLSRYYASQFSRTQTLLRAAVIPGMVFVFGIIVGAVALSLFQPIVALIYSVTW